MYIDNLTIAGILVVIPFALLPLLFGREILRVEEDDDAQILSPRTNREKSGKDDQDLDCGLGPSAC
jgi:hypothetical protein